MKCFLVFLLVVGISMTLCDAYCHFLQNDPLKSTKGCVQHGKVHSFGTAWLDDCHRCECTQNGIRCCSIFHSPRGYDKEKCESIFDKSSCSFEVVEKADHSKTCEVGGWVG